MKRRRLIIFHIFAVLYLFIYFCEFGMMWLMIMFLFPVFRLPVVVAPRVAMESFGKFNFILIIHDWIKC